MNKCNIGPFFANHAAEGFFRFRALLFTIISEICITSIQTEVGQADTSCLSGRISAMWTRFYAYTTKSAWDYDISSQPSLSLCVFCQVVESKLTMQRAFPRWQRRRTFRSERAIIPVAGCCTAPCTLSTTSPLPRVWLQSKWPLECREDFSGHWLLLPNSVGSKLQSSVCLGWLAPWRCSPGAFSHGKLGCVCLCGFLSK